MSAIDQSQVISPAGVPFALEPDKWIGPLLLSNLFGCVLLGVSIVQAINYNTAFSSGHRLRRIGVNLMVFFLVWQQTQRSYFLYSELSTNFGNWTYLGDSQTFVVNISSGWTTAAVVLLVQSFYVDRCYRLNSNTSVFVTFFFGIATSALSIRTSTIEGQGVPISLVIAFSNATRFLLSATDLMISGAMAFTLFRMRTGWSQTDTIINQLIRVTLESALIPAVHAICLFILADHFGKTRDSFLYNIFGFTVAGINVATCLQALLIKTRIRGQLSGQSDSNANKTSGPSRGVNIYPTQNRTNGQQQFELRSTPSRGQVLSHGGIHVETDVVTYAQDGDSEGADDWESQKGASSSTQLASRTKGDSMV